MKWWGDIGSGMAVANICFTVKNFDELSQAGIPHYWLFWLLFALWWKIVFFLWISALWKRKGPTVTNCPKSCEICYPKPNPVKPWEEE